MLLAALLACTDMDFIYLPEITNRWWLTEDYDISFYLEDPSHDSYWQYGEPLTTLSANNHEGSWKQLGPNKFSVDIYEQHFVVHAELQPDGCYKLRMNTLFSDTACPLEEP